MDDAEDGLHEAQVVVGTIKGSKNIAIQLPDQALVFNPDSALRIACALADAAIENGADMQIVFDLMADMLPDAPRGRLDA